MKLPIIIFREITHRKINFLLAAAAVMLASAMYVAFNTTAKASANETRKLMLEMGQNLRIIPKDTEMDRFWVKGFSELSMPEEYVYRFAEKTGYSYTHLTATLHKSIDYRGKNIVLTGILPEVFPPEKSWQKPMTFSVEQGKAYVGYEIADSLKIQEGDRIDIKGEKLEVVRTLSPTGSIDDIRIYGHLVDVQAILNMPGRINEIRALECMCFSRTEDDPLKAAQSQLKDLLPEGKVLLLDGIAQIRIKQRRTIQKHMNFVMNLTIVGCGVMIGVLAMLNVRERRVETGILRALGYNGLFVLLIFLIKALIIAAAGAAAGFFVGSQLALSFGPDIFTVTAEAIRTEYSLLSRSLLWCCVLVMIASFLPAITAITLQPAETLREN